MSAPFQRYSTVAMAFHWVIAILITAMVFYGWWMEDIRDQAFSGEVPFTTVEAVYNWHKTIGITILILSLGRLGWRLMHTPPPLSPSLKPYEKLAAHGVHWIFYGVMIGAPIMGWITASAGQFPTKLFNSALTLPRLPVPQNEGFEDLAGSLHGASGWVILILLGLHVGAALKHQFLDKDGNLARMIPFVPAPKSTVSNDEG